MEQLEFLWTDGTNEIFHHFYRITEQYYSRIVGGAKNREAFIPYNISENIQYVLLVYKDGVCVACSGMKQYSEQDIEIKRVWVEPAFRGEKIATQMMSKIEKKAKEMGFRRTILQTRPIMEDAVALYKKLGYYQIENYPPYDKLQGAVCYAKDI